MDKFNPYISEIDIDYWRGLCVREGVLRHYRAGDFFLQAGKTGRFIGFVKTGILKYMVMSISSIWNLQESLWPISLILFMAFHQKFQSRQFLRVRFIVFRPVCCATACMLTVNFNL